MSTPVAQALAGVSPDVAEACAHAWRRLGARGEWWTGAERRAMAEQARLARSCPTCAERKRALTPGLGTDGHSDAGPLDAKVVDAVHRIATDPGRRTRRWFDAVGLPDGRYVELVGVIFTQTLVDSLAVAIGAPLPELPDAEPGSPRQVPPRGAAPGGAWVRVLPPEHWTGELAELYASAPPGAPVANVILALSFVPAEHLNLITLMRRTYRHPEPVLSEPQIQLLASGVSAYNDCFY